MLRSALVLLFAFAPVFAEDAPKKRPLTHADYEIWNAAGGVKVSPDGKWFAYVLNVPLKDGVVVLRNIGSGAEQRFPTGNKGAVPTPEAPGTPKGDDQTAAPVAPPPPNWPLTGPPLSTPRFSTDGRFVGFLMFPLRIAPETPASEKAKTGDLPGAAFCLVECSTGKVVRRVGTSMSFRMVGEGAGLVIVEHEPKASVVPKTETAPPPAKANDDEDQAPGRSTGANVIRPQTVKDLLILDLESGAEHVFADVVEYALIRGGMAFAYTVLGKNPDSNGLYFCAITGPHGAVPIHKAAGKFGRLTWNRDESKLAYSYDDAPKATPPAPPKPRVYLWERGGGKPGAEILGPSIAGLKPGWQVVERGGMSFTADGKKLIVATAKAANAVESKEEPKAEAKTELPATRFPRPAAASADKVDLDLWHWKDEAVQTMQKARGTAERNRTYAAAYFLDDKSFKHLQDENLSVSPPSHGDWGFGYSDKRIRAETWDYPQVGDYSLVNIRSGESKPIKRAMFGFAASPTLKHLAGFDGQNWFVVDVPSGATRDLTAKLPAKFFHEDNDIPSIPGPYGLVGWSADDKFLFVADKFDLWKLAADGSSAVNVIRIGRTSGVRFRLARVEKKDDPSAEPQPGLDPTVPWLLAAENLTTRDAGFYRMMPGAEPTLLLMGPKKYSVPTKAKDADAMVFTVSNFQHYPDWYVADREFHDVKKLTDINPRTKDFLWGTAELMNYTSLDGTKLQATLYKPEDFDPSKKYPMIVYIYERLTDRIHDFRLPSAGTSINPTFYTSNGYLVLMPDVAFKIGSPGQSSLKCVLASIQAVADKGFLDEGAVGIQGHSWGGYQIAYLVTQTNRFKAAVAGAPVSDMVSAYGGIRWGTGLPRQFQYEKSQSRIGETLWQAPMKYIENSPIFMADRVTTPLLMLHNDQDDAVPWYQGIEYFLALRRLGREAYMLNYNGQPHGLTKKSAQRDYTLRMQQFFDHHLKGAAMPEWMAKGIPYSERDTEKEQWKKLFGPEEKK